LILKRLTDLLASSIGLLLTTPLLAVIAVCIRLDSAGPAFFRQERVGRNGRPFRIHKFRTMRQVTGPSLTVGRDPRITRVGAFLRRYKLDELPQLLDVLRGDMSLVGPRPELPRYVALYPPEVRSVVLSVRPGITDEASIEFSRESELLAGSADPEGTYRDEILPRKLELYVRYVRSRSFVGDLRILARTLGKIAGHRGGHA